MQWFSGFSDAEGSFIISTPKETKEVHFRFKITLHLDDSEVLYLIKNKLGIGTVTKQANTCEFNVSSFNDIIVFLIPIFNKYPLLSHKQLDYRDWKKAILLKKEAQLTSKNLSTSKYSDLVNIKNNINSVPLGGEVTMTDII